MVKNELIWGLGWGGRAGGECAQTDLNCPTEEEEKKRRREEEKKRRRWTFTRAIPQFERVLAVFSSNKKKLS